VRIQAAISRVETAPPAIEDVELEEPRAGEVLVRIVASGICHTDVKVSSTSFMSPKPIVLGHEGAGVVERVGAGVSAVVPGDHVVLSASSCGRCRNCLASAPSYCAEMLPRNFGGSRLDGTTPFSQDGQPIHGRFFGQSSFATHALVEERSTVKVPRDLPLELLGPLGCGVITGAGSVIHALRVRPGQSLAIFGAGAVGLSALLAARLAGASRIVAVDLVPARLELASELGATDVIDARNEDPLGRIRELVPGGVDVSFNTTQSVEVFTQALGCLALRGVAGFVASPEAPWTPDMRQLQLGRAVRGIIGGDAVPQLFIPALIDHYRQGRFPFDRLIRFYEFDRIADAFRDSEHGDTIKPVLRMPA
jgi:aryl-alcohol dehydrogenase